MIRHFVAYYRVSTVRQGDSGLGLEAQQQAVCRYLESQKGVALEQYVEVESGARAARPKLKEAIEACRKRRAILVIAKLDRLARNVHLISGLMDSGVEFVAVDNPHANRLMLHMLAAFAEHEREQISRRTKEALAAAKARGVVLGQFGVVLAQRNRRSADEFAKTLMPVLAEVDPQRELSLREIADKLNARQIPSYAGRCWRPMSVFRLRRRTLTITPGVP